MSDAEKPVEPTEDSSKAEAYPFPPAGPHARPELTNPDATPGTGSLPDATHGHETDPGGG